MIRDYHSLRLFYRSALFHFLPAQTFQFFFQGSPILPVLFLLLFTALVVDASTLNVHFIDVGQGDSILESDKENKTPWQLAKEKEPGLSIEVAKIKPVILDDLLALRHFCFGLTFDAFLFDKRNSSAQN